MSLAAPVFSREFIAGFPAMTSTSSSCNWQRERDSLCSWVRLALDVYIVPNLDGIYSCIWTQVVKPCLDRGGPSKTLRVSDMPFWSAWSTQESELDSASRFRKGFEEALRDFASGQRSSGGSSFTSGQHNVTRDGVAKLLDNLYIEPSAVITGSQFNQLRTYVRTVLKFRLKIDTVQIASSRLALEEPMVLEEVMVRRWPALLEVVSKSRRLSVEPYAYDTRLHTAALWHCVLGAIELLRLDHQCIRPDLFYKIPEHRAKGLYQLPGAGLGSHYDSQQGVIKRLEKSGVARQWR